MFNYDEEVLTVFLKEEGVDCMKFEVIYTVVKGSGDLTGQEDLLMVRGFYI